MNKPATIYLPKDRPYIYMYALGAVYARNRAEADEFAEKNELT